MPCPAAAADPGTTRRPPLIPQPRMASRSRPPPRTRTPRPLRGGGGWPGHKSPSPRSGAPRRRFYSSIHSPPGTVRRPGAFARFHRSAATLSACARQRSTAGMDGTNWPGRRAGIGRDGPCRGRWRCDMLPDPALLARSLRFALHARRGAYILGLCPPVARRCWGIRSLALLRTAWRGRNPSLGVRYADGVRWGWAWFLDPPFSFAVDLGGLSVPPMLLRIEGPNGPCLLSIDQPASSSTASRCGWGARASNEHVINAVAVRSRMKKPMQTISFEFERFRVN